MQLRQPTNMVEVTIYSVYRSVNLIDHMMANEILATMLSPKT